MRRDVTFSPHVFRSNVADATTLRLDLRLDQSRDLNEEVSNGKERIPLVEDRGGYLKFIHPAICERAKLREVA